MLPSFATQAVTIVRPATKKDHGKTVPDPDKPGTEIEVEGCSVQPGATMTALANRRNVQVAYTLLAPPDAPFKAGDLVLYEGSTYRVDGQPAPWSSPTGGLAYVAVYLVANRDKA